MSDLQDSSRRQFLKKSAYVIPAIMTFKAAPSLACYGSPCKEYDGGHDYYRDYDNYSRYDGKYDYKKDYDYRDYGGHHYKRR